MPSLPSPHQFFGNHKNGYQENDSRDNSQNSSSGSAHMTNDLLNYESHIRIVTPEQSSSLSDSVFASREKSQKSQSSMRGTGRQQQINSSTGETPSSPHILSPNPISNGAGDIGSEVFTVQKPDMRARQPEIRGKQPSRASSISHPRFAQVETTSLESGTSLSDPKSGKAATATVHEGPDSSSHDHVFLSPSEVPKRKSVEKEKKAASLSISSVSYAPLESNHSSIPHEPIKPLKKCNSNIEVPKFQRTPLPNNVFPLNHSTPYFAETTPIMPRPSVHEEGASEYNLNDQTAAEKKENANGVNQLRDLILQMEWARHALKGVQKKYFDRQREAMKNGWKELDEAIEEFHRNKSEENSKIAQIRAGLAEEKRKYSARNEEKQIKELEEEMKKLKSTDTQKTRLVSELRAKINGLEGTNKANEEAAAKNMQLLKDTKSRLTKSEMENSNLRVRMAMLKERTLAEASEAGASKSSATPKNTPGPPKRVSLLGTPRFNRSSSASQFSNVSSADDSSRPRSADLSNKTVRWSSPVASSRSFSNFNPAFAVPTSSSRMTNSDMVNTKFEITSKGREYTFSNGPIVTTFTELNCYCMLYEHNNLDFRWIGRTANGRIQVYYSDAGKVYEVKTAEDSRILFFVNNQLEVHWKNGDRTLITPDGKRVEMFCPDNAVEGLRFEMFEDDTNLQWGTDKEPEEINDNPSSMSRRPNGAYTYVVDGNSTEVKAPDFALRRVNDGFVKIVIREVQLSFCVDNVFLAKHVVETNESDGRVKKQKQVCFSRGDCVHIKK